MKRALALLLVTSMLSTSTVYAAGDLESLCDVPEYTEGYSQGEGEDYSCQEEYSDCETEYCDEGSESDSEAESADADDGAYSGGESAGYSETETDNRSAEASPSAEYAADGEKGEVTEKTETVSDPEVTDQEESVISMIPNAEGMSDSKDLKPESEADSNEINTEGVSDSKDLRVEGASDSKGHSTDGCDSYDIYEAYGNESEASVGKTSDTAAEKSGGTTATPDVLKVVPPDGQNGTAEGNSTRTRIAIMSDLHYVTDKLISEIGRDNLADASMTEMRLMEEIDAILAAALEGASRTEPDALLICGDLVSNGELLGARTLAEKLKAAKEKPGFANTGFYVVNGNHDINNSYAADFTGETVANAERVQPSDFAEVFSGLGYGDDDHWAGGSHSVYKPESDDPTQITNHGGLSYATDIADGITLIVLDTGIYRTDESGQSMYNNAQKTAGYVSDDLLAWAAEQAREAKAKGNLVLAMSHHGLLPHYDTDLEEKAAWYMDSFRVPNWEKVAETLADAGVSAVLTGHTHANDIATYVSKNNNVLYDVETAALCAYPCLWREFEIVTSGEGDEKTYTISVDTTYINDDLQADTSSWSFTIGDKTRTFDEDYNHNLQDYAYDKTGFNEGSADSSAMYMIKNTLSDIVTHKDGLAGYIKEKLDIPEDQSLGDYAAASLRKLINSFTGFTKSISTAFLSGDISIENATQEGDENPTFNITAEMSGRKEYGKATIDLSYIPTAVNEMTAKTQAKLLEGAWLINPYATNPLLDDIKKLIRNAVMPALSQPLEENDPNSTALNMFNDAWQSFAKGDEGLADEEQKAKWEHERELIGGEVLAGKLTQGLWTEALKLNTSKYPTLSELLSQRIVEENKKGIITITTENPGDYLLPAITNLIGVGSLDTMSSIIRTASALDTVGMGNPIPSGTVKPITDKIIDLHEVMTTDNNITHDNTWDFQMVRFDANGGSVGQTHALTVEDHKLVNLPTPDERENYTFDGWFTSETGGRQVTAGEDMTGINTLYAHWTYNGEDREEKGEEEEEKDPGEKDGEKTEPEKQDDRNKNDDSRTEPTRDSDENPSPAIPSAAAYGRTSNGRTGYKDTEPATGDRADWNLHNYFVSRKALHEKIYHVEYNDTEHTKYCAAIVSALKKGETVINMGKWLSLDANAVNAIEESGADVTIEYVGQGIGFRVLIPAGSEISRLADDHGYVCIVCLAETYGYERIGENEVLRRPLS